MGRAGGSSRSLTDSVWKFCGDDGWKFCHRSSAVADQGWRFLISGKNQGMALIVSRVCVCLSKDSDGWTPKRFDIRPTVQYLIDECWNVESATLSVTRIQCFVVR